MLDVLVLVYQRRAGATRIFGGQWSTLQLHTPLWYAPPEGTIRRLEVYLQSRNLAGILRPLLDFPVSPSPRISACDMYMGNGTLDGGYIIY